MIYVLLVFIGLICAAYAFLAIGAICVIVCAVGAVFLVLEQAVRLVSRLLARR